MSYSLPPPPLFPPTLHDASYLRNRYHELKELGHDILWDLAEALLAGDLLVLHDEDLGGLLQRPGVADAGETEHLDNILNVESLDGRILHLVVVVDFGLLRLLLPRLDSHHGLHGGGLGDEETVMTKGHDDGSSSAGETEVKYPGQPGFGWPASTNL